ncbi:MAG: alanyl-tRNA editing protein [Tissierella sp.]|uniref:alanyl-tRNA editing protein n=1 Tax=Tissierella sp. TaxID=41274 RepID=UPI003F99420E
MTKKLYINNPYLKETHARVIDKSFENDNFHIKLDRTIFYPHMSGGQPKDLGTICEKEVIDVYEDGLNIVHVLEEDIDSKDVNLSIDWNNRFDLMQQHTGQHILSAAFLKLFNAKTIAFHMGEKYITIDVDIVDINDEEILQIETLSNKIIQSNFNVTSSFLDSSNITDLDLSKVPEEEQDNIRIVNIDNISTTPCSGTHVSSTGEIGLIKIINTTNYKGNTRVSFICGNRSLKDYSLKNRYINKISLSLSSGITDVLDKFLKLKEDKENLQKKNKNLKEEIISLKGNRLLEKKKNINGIDYIIENLEGIDKKELNLISSYLNKEENLIQIYKLEDKNQGMFLISKSHNLDINLKELFDSIAQKIIVKGGGNKEKIQGTTSPTIIDRVIEMFYKEIQAYLKTKPNK